MKIPNIEQGLVPERKLTHYLLDSTHPAGGSKAKFFLRFWFKRSEWKSLAEKLMQHAQENDAAEIEATEYGIRYVVDGILIAPDGTNLNIRSAWFIRNHDLMPVFVTAHPLPKI